MTDQQKSIDSVITKIADLGIKTIENTIENVIQDFDCDMNNKNDNFDFENNKDKTLSDIFDDNSESFKKKSSNRYLIQSCNYDVELQSWELIEDKDGDYFVSGQLENKNFWNSSYIKHIDIKNDHLKIRTINNTIYRCFYTESLDYDFGRRIYF